VASWAEFESAAPALGAIARARIDAVGLVLLGTKRANGWPRISPVEPLVTAGDLHLGMMWQSRKARDLLADDRCVVHSTVSDKAGTEGDVKVSGHARSLDDPDRRRHYADALFERIGWRPEGDYHLFVIDITEVGYFKATGDRHETRVWRPGEPEPAPRT
jgi:hypothetical protein